MRMSIRFWQTTLFVCVTLAAALVLYATFLPPIKHSIGIVVKSELEKNLEDLSNKVAKGFASPEFEREIALEARKFSDVYHVDLWIYDSNGQEIYAHQSLTQPGSLLEDMLDRGLKKREYTFADLDKNLVVASGPIESNGRLLGVAVISDNGARANDALKVARDKLLIAFAVAILVSAILGFIFSEVISRQIRRLKEGALAIAQGNFDLRLKRGLMPDDVAELARTFNVMAEKLADAFTAIRSQQEQILTVINSMTEGVIEVSADGMMNLANPAAARLLDYPVEKLIGSQLEDVISEPNLLKCAKRALSGRTATGICEYHKRFLLIHSAPIEVPESHSNSQNKGGIVLILQDFTERRRLEQVQRDFISNASHELRTPIASLKGFLELLEDGAKNRTEVRDSFLNTMQTEVDRLQRLVEDLFTLAQLDSGIDFLQMSEQPIDQIVQETVAATAPLAASAGVDLKLDALGNHATVFCDKDRIIQVLLGFVDNAIKHTPKGGEIVVFSQLSGDSVTVGVKDNGSGIPPDRIEHILERFYRYETKNSKKRGAGLGLSIASEIVKAHGSRIKVSSKPHEVTTFSFKLRLMKS